MYVCMIDRDNDNVKYRGEEIKYVPERKKKMEDIEMVRRCSTHEIIT